MNTKLKNKWDGFIGLAWLCLVIIYVVEIPTHIHSRLSEYFGFFWICFWMFGWWLPTLYFAISGLWRGNMVSRICAISTICVALLFSLYLYASISWDVRR